MCVKARASQLWTMEQRNGGEFMSTGAEPNRGKIIAE